MHYSHGFNFTHGFCIVIPSWNNMRYLRKCISSIQEYSEFPHQIIVHLNEGSAQEMEELEELEVAFTMSPRNLGVCAAVNKAAVFCKKPLIMYANDDMVFLPGWDTELAFFYEEHNLGDKFWLSSTMIEPLGKRPEMIAPYNYGKSPEDFYELKILNDLELLRTMQPNINGTTWPPNLMPYDLFEKIGGFSEEYFPGFGSDPDLAKKAWDKGVRNFVGVGRSLVYHFQCITTIKLQNMNNGHEIFKQQHNISMDHFVNNMLKRGEIWHSPIES